MILNKNFQCKICSNKFTNNSHLNRHIRLVHNKQTEGYKCPFCLGMFYNKSHQLKCNLNPDYKYKIFIKNNKELLDKVYEKSNELEIYDYKLIINLWKKTLENHVENLKKNLDYFDFIDSKTKTKYFEEYKNKVYKNIFIFEKFYINKNNLILSNKNLNNNNNKIFINKKLELLNFIQTEFEKKFIKKVICLHCLKYVDQINDHVFRIRPNKPAGCCENFLNNILKLNKNDLEKIILNNVIIKENPFKNKKIFLEFFKESHNLILLKLKEIKKSKIKKKNLKIKEIKIDKINFNNNNKEKYNFQNESEKKIENEKNEIFIKNEEEIINENIFNTFFLPIDESFIKLNKEEEKENLNSNELYFDNIFNFNNLHKFDDYNNNINEIFLGQKRMKLY